MINAGKVEFGWSVRQAEADSGLGRHTVWRLMKPGGDVERRGYLKPVRRSRPGAHHADQPDKASTWRCVARRGKARQAPSAVHSASGLSRKTASLPTSPALNLFHRQANAWHIDQRLQEGEQVTVKELVTELGVIPDTVRRALRYLESHGLARRVNRTEWEGTATRADADAPARDGVDHQAKRCERHRTERKKFKDWCAARRAAREEQAERLDAERSQRIEEAWEGMTPTFDEVTGRPIETRPDRPDVDPETGELLEVAA
jgi:DNA-binding transcriptional regulator YhcF (GntR family)